MCKFCGGTAKPWNIEYDNTAGHPIDYDNSFWPIGDPLPRSPGDPYRPSIFPSPVTIIPTTFPPAPLIGPNTTVVYKPDPDGIRIDDIMKIIAVYAWHQIVTFKMFRGKDSSGVSGTGLVLEGVIFTDRTTVVHWVTKEAPSSTTTFGNEDGTHGLYKFINIHVRPHPLNETKIVFSTGHYWKQEADPAAVASHEEAVHYGHEYAESCVYCQADSNPLTESQEDTVRDVVRVLRSEGFKRVWKKRSDAV